MESCSFKQTSQSERGRSGKRRRDTLSLEGGGWAYACKDPFRAVMAAGEAAENTGGPRLNRGEGCHFSSPNEMHESRDTDFIAAFHCSATLLARFARVDLTEGAESRGTNGV